MNYVFKVFVTKFLNLYIEGFGGSQVQLYQGALNLQKVQLKLQTLNKLLKDLFLPFTILKADIGMLKIDIPWSSLTTQPIKTMIQGLNVIIQYNSEVDYLVEGLKQNNDYSIQDEIRKHKEIDEQVLKRFVKKLLLNLSFEIHDIQVELLIKQQYRLQVVCQEFGTSCQENLRINVEDVDQFHRQLRIETFFIKLIRFKDDDVSNQQLLALDQCNSYLERGKDSIHCDVEFNNLNLIVDKDIVLLLKESLDQQAHLEQLIQQKLIEYKLQPIHENFVFRDIVTVTKGIHISVFANNVFIQSQQLSVIVQQCQISAKQFLQQILYKANFQEINIKYNGFKLITLAKQSSNSDYSIWPEHYIENSEMIMIEVVKNQNERMKLIEQKTLLQLEHLHIELDMHYILLHAQSIIAHLQSYQHFVEMPQKTQPHIKSLQLKMNYKLNLMKFRVSIKSMEQDQFQLLLQSNTQICIYKKKNKLKTIDFKHSQLQFQIIDKFNHILLSINGLNVVFDYFKQIVLNVNILSIQMRIHNQTIQQVQLLAKLLQNYEKQEIQPSSQQEIQQTKRPFQINVTIDRCIIEFGQLTKAYVSLIAIKQKCINLSLLIQDDKLNNVILKSNFNLWTTHPLQKQSCKITNTIKIKLTWSSIFDQTTQELQNTLQVLNTVEIKLSQLTISNLLNTITFIDMVPVIRNKTKQKLLVKISNTILSIEPNELVLLPPLYDNLQDIADYPQYNVQLGMELNESLQFWSSAYPFHFSKQYFNKFVIVDEIDQHEHDIFLKAQDNEFILTQQDKPLPDLSNVAEPTFENQSEYLIVFKTGNAEQLTIEGNSKQVFHTKLTEQSALSLSLLTENQQEIKFTLKDTLKTVLSFNFVKIDANFYNVLLSLELIRDPKGQYFQKLILKPFLVVINLLPWDFSIGNSQFINLPISVDVNMNNALINNFDTQLDQFYSNLLNNRKHTVNPSQQIVINNQITNLYYINFLKEGKYAIEINKKHHMIMIFRNNVLVQNQMCFVICKNIYQPQIKYLLMRNQTKFNFILMKNKSRIHIYPSSDNCLEYNIQKGDKYRIFITNSDYELLQLLDTETLAKHHLKVNKIQIQNIHIIEILVNQEKIMGQEFKITIPKISIVIQICDKQELNFQFDLSMRFFSDTHLDILIQSFALLFEQTNIVTITDCFSILEMSKSQDLNLLIINNLFFKIKEIKLQIQQKFLNAMKLLISLLRLDPLFRRKGDPQPNKWESLIQPIIVILNLILDPIQLDINIQTNIINMNNSIQLPQLQMKMKKFKPNQLNQEIISFYLAYLITKIPTIQLLFQNIPNPFSLLHTKKIDLDIVKLPYFFVQEPLSTLTSVNEYLLLQKKCKFITPNGPIKCELQLSKQKLEIINQVSIDMNKITSIRHSNSFLTIHYDDKQIQILSKQSNLILALIKQLLY